MNPSKGLVALGNRVSTYSGLETFETPRGVSEVTLTSDEVTALCPVTEQPDWYTISVRFRPLALCVESKTFKLFLQSFRNEGLFCEALSARILDEFVKSIKPEYIQVRVIQKPRGGVSIEAVSTK